MRVCMCVCVCALHILEYGTTTTDKMIVQSIHPKWQLKGTNIFILSIFVLPSARLINIISQLMCSTYRKEAINVQ